MSTPSEALGKLIRACVDDERTLRHESARVDDAVRALRLARMAGERDLFVVDLERLGGAAQPQGGSWRELARETRRNVWQAAAGRNGGDSIRSCRRSRARTEEAYDRALGDVWSEEVRRILAAQRIIVQDEADELIRLQF